MKEDVAYLTPSLLRQELPQLQIWNGYINPSFVYKLSLMTRVCVGELGRECCIFGIKPLAEPMITDYWQRPKRTIFNRNSNGFIREKFLDSHLRGRLVLCCRWSVDLQQEKHFDEGATACYGRRIPTHCHPSDSDAGWDSTQNQSW